MERETLLRCVTYLLQPAVSYCLRHSLRLQDIIECAKASFVKNAQQQLDVIQQTRSTSRVSVMTGVHRKDVDRLEQGLPQDRHEKDLVARVLGSWLSDPRFRTVSGHPRILPIDGEEISFYSLVSSISQDLHPKVVLLELERVAAVERTNRGLKLLARAYVPKGDLFESYAVLAKDLDDLSQAVELNTIGLLAVPELHLRTEYDKVRAEAINEIKAALIKEGHLLHAKVREILSRHDQDVNPKLDYKGETVRVVLGTFSLTEHLNKNGEQR